MKFINIIGTTGSGKSTFARKLADQRKLQYIELDNLLWLDDWQESSNDALFLKLKIAMENAATGWTIDGLYTRTIPMIMEKVDTVIWLDYSFSLNLYRSVKRAISRAVTQKRLWANSNNRESFKTSFLSKDSIILWMITHHAKNRKKYLAMINDPQYQHIQFIHLTSPKQTEAFFKQMKAE